MASPIPSPKIPRHLILLFLLLILLIGTGGYLYYGNQKKHIKKEKESELLAIADLKVNQIASWRKERLGDAEVLFENYQFIRQLRRWLKSQEKSMVMEDMLGWMSSVRGRFDYSSIFLLDEKGKVCLYSSEAYDEVGPHIKSFVNEVIQARKIKWIDLYRDETDRHIHLDILVPLLPREPDGFPSGVLLFRINPYQFLYSFVQSWPTPSRTAESLMVRREGIEVLFLNELRHQKQTALSLRLPITGKQTVAVKAVQGVEGVVEGADYRGVEVLAAVRKIPGSPWYLIAKVDQEEIYAPIRQHAILVLVFVAALILSGGGVVGFLWRNQTARFYRKQYDNEIERQALLKHFEYLVKYANDIILLADRNWQIFEVNDRAVEIYGYSRDELLKMDIKQLRAPEERFLLEKQFQELDKQKGLTLQTIHHRKDGAPFPVEASLRVIEVEGKKFYQSIIRDITERKKAEEKIREERDKAQKYLDITGTIIVVIASDQTVSLINRKGCEVLGCDEKEIVGKNWFDTCISERMRNEVKTIFYELMAGKIETVKYFENPVLTKSGEERMIAWYHTVFKDEWGNILATLSSGEDITERKRREKEREKLIHELREALAQVKTLSGLVPICASCKKIRDDKGYWNQIELYIEKHSTAEFSHGICPECARRLYPQLYDEEDDGKPSPDSSEQK